MDVGARLALSIGNGVEGRCGRAVDVYRFIRVNNVETDMACSDVTAAPATLIFPNEPSSNIRRHRYVTASSCLETVLLTISPGCFYRA